MEFIASTYLATLAGFAGLVLLLTGYLTKGFNDRVLFWVISLKQVVSVVVAEALGVAAFYIGTPSIFNEMSLVMVCLTSAVAAGLANGWVTHEWAQRILELLKARLVKK